MTQIERISEMEKILDKTTLNLNSLLESVRNFTSVLPEYKMLLSYYSGGLWMKDFEDDENGKLPKNLKRGVLSEDAVYDLITEIQNLKNELAELSDCL